MLNFHKDVKSLVLVSGGVFLVLSFFVSILPASEMTYVQPLPTAEALSEKEREGLHVYVSENCMACHTQQVRNIEMDNMWGDRPSIPSDYYYDKQRLSFWQQSPSVLGSERTGPDLTNIGQRQPSESWHLLHLYNPRSVVGESIMPSYPWMFEAKDTTAITEEDVVVPVPEEFFNQPGKKIVAKPEALQLVAYLKSLKQAPMPSGATVEFIPELEKDSQKGENGGTESSLGKKLYMNTCASCHQQNGQGLPGAFPPLAGSPIVNDENPELMLQIIIQGYDARSEYGIMPGLGGLLTNEEIAAIATYERSNWGNQAPPVTPEDVERVRKYIESFEGQQ
jgi:cytochrome c oxidase cbb3-type subunit 2